MASPKVDLWPWAVLVCSSIVAANLAVGPLEFAGVRLNPRRSLGQMSGGFGAKSERLEISKFYDGEFGGAEVHLTSSLDCLRTFAVPVQTQGLWSASSRQCLLTFAPMAVVCWGRCWGKAMAREINKLSARSVATISKAGRHSDGGGLYLQVSPAGAKSWLFLFRWQGKLKEMGLGGVAAVSLAEAREKAAQARKATAAGQNPIETRRSVEAAAAAKTTFGDFADQLVEDIKGGFRNEKHRWQWGHTLTVYAAKLRPIPVDEVGTEQVLEVLQPLWQTKQETAARLRGRIERVLDAAKAKGLRTGENPARWRGHLDNLLSRRQKLKRGHHPAMPFEDVPAFVAELRERDAVAALMLEFTILCASRTGEVVGAQWGEIDRKAKVWTVPKDRMKAGKEHRVPLGPRALEILGNVEKLRGKGDWIFPGPRKGKPFSNMAMLMLLKVRMDRADLTVHGFRSSFRDWAGERTAFPREVAEAALAHIVGDEVERAYRRGDALDKRRKLMLAWEEFVTGKAADNKVVPLHA